MRTSIGSLPAARNVRCQAVVFATVGALVAASAVLVWPGPANAAPLPHAPGDDRLAAQSSDTASVEILSPDRKRRDTEAPSPPGRPQVLGVSPTTATITWAPSTDNFCVVEYLVYQGHQYYGGSLVRTVTSTAPITLTLSPTSPLINFSVRARDAAGNTSMFSPMAYVQQPPSFPKTGDETEPPTPPGAPTVTGVTPDGEYILTWAPATDNVGVVEYHVIHTSNIDDVRVVAKVPGNVATIQPRGGGLEFVTIVAFDAAWNSSRSPLTPLGPPPTPTPTPTPPAPATR